MIASAHNVSVHQGHRDVMKFLLESGANVNAMESNGDKLTPLDYANANGHTSIAKYLVRVMCDV